MEVSGIDDTQDFAETIASVIFSVLDDSDENTSESDAGRRANRVGAV